MNENNVHVSVQLLARRGLADGLLHPANRGELYSIVEGMERGMDSPACSGGGTDFTGGFIGLIRYLSLNEGQ